MGIESKGMVLAADNNGAPVVLSPIQETPIGVTIK